MRFQYYKVRPKNHKFPVIAWMIMAFQGMAPWKKSSTSHRALGYHCPARGMRVVDSTGDTGVRDSHVDEFKNQYKIVETVEFDAPLHKAAFFIWVGKIVGRKYDFLQVWGLLFKRLFGFISFNSLGKNFRALTCNEVILHFLIEFDLTKTEVKDPDNWDLLMTDKLIDKMRRGGYGYISRP